jgi:hypothetical protein
MLTVRTNNELLNHLQAFDHDGATVDSLLFEGGRLSYPGRKEIEYQLGYVEPYTLDLEARVIEGMSKKMAASIRLLSREAMSRRWFKDLDPTLELLWMAHGAWHDGVSLDRLVAALVMVDYAMNERTFDSDIEKACEVLVQGMYSLGFPPTEAGLEELFDGAPPACVGLGLVEL